MFPSIVINKKNVISTLRLFFENVVFHAMQELLIQVTRSGSKSIVFQKLRAGCSQGFARVFKDISRIANCLGPSKGTNYRSRNGTY